MTSRPRCSAAEAYSKSRSGVRCAETMRVSCGTFRPARMFEACSMVSQSEVEPMMMPTRGLASLWSGRFTRLYAFLEQIVRFFMRSEEHTSELQSRLHLVCRLLLETKKLT